MPKEYTLIGGNGTRVSPLEVNESGTYEAGDSRAFNPVKVNVPIDFDHSSNSISSQPADPKKLSRIFLRFVSLFFIKLPRLYGGSVTIKSIDSALICCIAAMQSWLYSVVSAI